MAKKILIVDDDLYLRELYEEVLKNEGYEVQAAKDGKAGLDLIMKNPFDLILLDIMLPQLDGIGVLTKLSQEKPSVPLGPIVLLTNLSHDPVVKEALSKGAKSVLIKATLNPEQFLEKVKEALGEKASTPAAPTTEAAAPTPAAPEAPPAEVLKAA